MGAPPYIPLLQPDLEMDAEILELNMVDELNCWVLLVKRIQNLFWCREESQFESKRIVGKDHLKLNLGNRGIDAIAFGFGPHMNKMPEKIDVAYRIERNVFRGRENLQLLVEDIRAHEPPAAADPFSKLVGFKPFKGLYRNRCNPFPAVVSNMSGNLSKIPNNAEPAEDLQYVPGHIDFPPIKPTTR